MPNSKSLSKESKQITINELLEELWKINISKFAYEFLKLCIINN